MQIDKSQVKRILFITLSNVGDIILTTPVLRALAKEFPDARIDVLVGPRGKEIFEKDPRIFKLIIYDKHLSVAQKRRLQLKLKKLSYDLIVDLRNTVFPILLGPKYRTATIHKFPKNVIHKRARHLHRLKFLGIDNLTEPAYIYIPHEDEEYAERILHEDGVSEPIIAVNPGAKSHLKRWTAEGFAYVCDKLIGESKVHIVFIGIDDDSEIVDKVIGKMKVKKNVHNFVNKTNIRQLAALLKRSKVLITNDSAPLHLGCAMGTKVLALFGPTDPRKYGPTGDLDIVITRKLHCSPCEVAECEHNYECMRLIPPEEVFDVAKLMVEGYEG